MTKFFLFVYIWTFCFFSYAANVEKFLLFKPSQFFSKKSMVAPHIEHQRAQEFSSEQWIDQGLPLNPLFPPCTKLEVGFNLKRVSKFLSDAEISDSSALIVVKDGCTAIEKHYGGAYNEVFSVQSVTKSIASLAIGKLLDQGILKNLDTPIANFFPSLKTDADKSKITIREILNQTSGFGDWDTSSNQGSNIVEKILNSPLQSKPGTNWAYSSMAVYLLGPIIEALTGQPAEKYMQEYVFGPALIQSAQWGENIDTGGGLLLNSRDMINIGQMMMDDGYWQNQQIISKNWIDLSLSSSQNFFAPYGMLWWLYGQQANSHYAVYSAVGYQGQYIVVYPKAHLIVVRIHRVEDTEDLKRLQRIFWEGLAERLPELVAP